ncbi:unnamed protein product [Candida verbasci]|uniref:NADH:flavin oxidoreductase/NADH oxidase N-terminal domain-containing protein n=1 Tax=Candida verbasci TaxID=1227364 RepID=A0A9W4X950_9ASCO|nr:unnamed protein product [Candida verbasci]
MKFLVTRINFFKRPIMTKSSIQSSNLFKPLTIGSSTVKNRIAHLPTTRTRAIKDGHVPTDLQLQYYTDRAKDGSLLITEATLISLNQGIYPSVPGIWNQQQAKAWKKIVDSVHENGGVIAAQLWALGRVGNAKLLKENGLPLTGPSANYEHEQAEKDAIEAGNPIQELTEEQIDDLINNQYPNAVKLASETANFDFVELHAANGYLFEQFIHPDINKRTDKYGGSIENRSRFLFNVLDKLFEIVDPQKVAIRISPANEFQTPRVNPSFVEDWTYIIKELQKRAEQGKALAFIDLVDARFNEDRTHTNIDLEFIPEIWKGILIRGGNYTYDDKDNWAQIVEDANLDDRTLVGFGRYFIANPDLPKRIYNDEELNDYDRSTFYSPYNYGYNTYPFLNEKLEVDPNEKRLGKSLT